MQAQVGESHRRQVVDDIDMFRMQSFNEEEETKQGTTLAAQSKESSHYAINYEYRSRDEVANAMLKLQGKGKQAGYVNRAQAQRPKPNDKSWVLSKEGREAAVFRAAVTQSHSSRTGSDRSMARSFISMSDVKSSQEAREPAVIEDNVNSSRTGPVLQQDYSIQSSHNNMSVARSFVTTNLASRAAVVEPGEQAVSDNEQRHSLHIQPKTNPAYIGNRSKKTKKTDGILKSLFRCGLCATETQLPDFSVVEEVKEYSVDEGLANHVQQGLKIETSSQFLSPPPPPSAYIHVAPCDVVHHSASIGGCSTITHSVAGRLVVRDEAEENHSFAGNLTVRDEPEVIRDNATTTKHSNMSASASSLMDRDNKADDHVDVVSKIPFVEDPSHEQMSEAEYESLGLGSKGTYTQHYCASKSDSASFVSVAGKGSSMWLSSASELGTRTQSQSFSLSLRDQDSNTFSSASGEDSDYTLTDGSSSSIDDSFLLSSYASTMQEDDSMTYGPSLSGSSSCSYDESR